MRGQLFPAVLFFILGVLFFAGISAGISTQIGAVYDQADNLTKIIIAGFLGICFVLMFYAFIRNNS